MNCPARHAITALLICLPLLHARAAENPDDRGGVRPMTRTVSSVPTEISPNQADTVRAALKQRVPDLAVVELHGTQIPGLFEVISPDGITYTDANADYVIMGELLDTRTRRNLTQEHWVTFGRVDFASLPFS